MRDRVGAVPDLAPDRLVAIDDLAHARLDLREVVRRERLVALEIVIEAVFDCGTECNLRAGIELLHRLGHDMRAVVTQQLQRVCAVARDDLDLGVLPDLALEVAQRAVDLHRERRLGEPGADIGRDPLPGDRPGIPAHAAVRQRYGNAAACGC